MSGAAIAIEITGIAELSRFADRLAGIDATPLLQGITAELEDQTRRRISSEKTAPDGSAWPALSPDYAQRKAENSSGGLLVLGGKLLDSISATLSGGVAGVGTNKIYGATHNYGDVSRGIPQREYLGVSTENQRDIQGVVDDWIMGVLNA